jgi:hypothetical protein
MYQYRVCSVELIIEDFDDPPSKGGHRQDEWRLQSYRNVSDIEQSER